MTTQEKVAGLKATITINLQATEDVAARYGYEDQVNLTFDAVLSTTDGSNVIEEFGRQLRHTLITLRRKQHTVKALQAAARPVVEEVIDAGPADQSIPEDITYDPGEYPF